MLLFILISWNIFVYSHSEKENAYIYTHTEKSTKLKGETWVPFDLGKFLLFSFLFLNFHFLFLQTRQWVLNFGSETSLEELIKNIFLKRYLFFFFFLVRLLKRVRGFKFLTACIELLWLDFSLDYEYPSSSMECKLLGFLGGAQ